MADNWVENTEFMDDFLVPWGSVKKMLTESGIGPTFLASPDGVLGVLIDGKLWRLRLTTKHEIYAEEAALNAAEAMDRARELMAVLKRRVREDQDRAVLEGETEGFVKIHCKRGTDSILGATVVASHAGEMISEITTAMTTGLGLKALASTIHPYPTQAEAIRKTADAYQRTRLTPRVRRLLQALLRLHG